jgi:DNA-binding response OmpR family regulator
MVSKVNGMHSGGAVGVATVMPDPRSDPSVLRGVSVLVVEDAWHVATAMKGALEQLGMHVLGPVATMVEARRLLATQRPRAAVVDVNLRGEMAWDLIDDLQKQDIDVIVMSGYALPDTSRGRPLTHLQKPFDGTELMAALCAVVGKSTY